MPVVSIQLDGMRTLEQMLDPKRVRRIRWSAINEAGRAGRTLFSRDIRTVLAAPAAVVNDAFRFSRADTADGYAEIGIHRKPIALKYFRPIQNKLGVSVLVRKDQGRRLIKGAFGPRIDKLHGRVYKRKTTHSEPKVELWGQTAASIGANSPGLLPRVSKRIAETLQDRYSSKLNYVLSNPSAAAI